MFTVIVGMGQSGLEDQVLTVVTKVVKPRKLQDWLWTSQIDLIQTVDLVNWLDNISDDQLVGEQYKHKKFRWIIDWLKKDDCPNSEELYLSNKACKNNWIKNFVFT